MREYVSVIRCAKLHIPHYVACKTLGNVGRFAGFPREIKFDLRLMFMRKILEQSPTTLQIPKLFQRYSLAKGLLADVLDMLL